MGIYDWMAVFYNTSLYGLNEREAIVHTLRLWVGLDKKVLRSFNIEHSNGILSDAQGGRLYVDSTTIALCWWWKTHASRNPQCVGCPLYYARGDVVREGVPCDQTRRDELIPPYHEFVNNDNAKPMIEWLKQTWRDKR